MNLSPVFKQRFFDANGLPLSGGLLYTYQAGTSTPQVTYSNFSGTANANPVVLDSSGYADIWLDPSLAYKVILQDSSANVLWTEDNITSTSQGISTWSANTVYSKGAIVEDGSGFGLLYVSLTDNNQNNVLTNVSNWRIFSGNVRTVSTNTTLAVTDDLVRSNSTSGSLTHTLPAIASTPVGKKIFVKDIGTGGNTTSVKGSGSDTVDGNVTWATALSAYVCVSFSNNGTTWDASFVIPDAAVITAKIADSAVTTAKINDSGVTTAKLNNNAVTPAKLSSANMVKSSGSGNFTTTSTSAASVGISAVITASGSRPILVYLTGTGTSGGAGNASYMGLNASNLSNVFIYKDGSPVSVGRIGAGVTVPPSMVYLDSTPTAGSHTYALFGDVETGGTLSIVNVAIVAHEL